MSTYTAYVDARHLDPDAKSSRALIDPSDGSTLAEVTDATEADVDRAVEVAHARFTEGVWRAAPVRHRRDVLARLADLVRRDSDALTRIESANVGKPIAAARAEVATVADVFDYYAGAIDKFAGGTLPSEADGTLLTFREPIGVCAAITPWNFPLVIASWKLAPALALGNSVVAKPASLTPLSLLALAELATEAGLPPGVLNVVPGPGARLGDRLVSHPQVRKVSFTGSTDTGTHVMRLAAADVTRVSLELGGKSANVVFADTDLDICVESSVWSALDNAGQDCCARSRMLVQGEVYDRFVEALVARVAAIRVGDPSDPETEMGPLVTAAHRESVEAHLDRATSDGATCLCGGERRGEGWYLTPSVLADVTPQMAVMHDEVFGPVIAVAPFDTEDDAIRLANDTIYGLSGSIWTRDIGRALRVARGVETGMLSINSSSSAHIEAPFGGVKASGLGREQGMAALEGYSELKTVFIARD